jgi:co-chaperonin GroES (HSP10)
MKYPATIEGREIGTAEPVQAETLSGKKVPLRPLHSFALVEAMETRQVGRIHLPDPKTPRPTRGRVLRVGPGHELDNGKRWTMPVVAGDLIWFREYGADVVEIELDGKLEKFYMVRGDQILCMLEV